MYRFTLIAGRAGLTDPFLWGKFPRLVPLSHNEETVTYTCKLDIDLSRDQRSILDGFVEEGDILSYEIIEERE